jgi:hypothetical protein
MINNSTNINKNHLSPRLIEWWSTILPISTKITSHLKVIFVDIGGIVDHHSMSRGERWFLLILVELLTYICYNKKVLQWWSTIPQISTKITSHLNSLSDVLLILVELLTITQWVEVGGDFCWYWWNCWPSLNELKWEVMFVDIGGIVDHHFIEWWSTIPPISTKITSHLNSLSDGQQFHQYQQTSPLTSTHWVMVNNSTNMNIGWYWWNCWPSLNELRWEVIVVDIGGIVDPHSMSLGERWFVLILVDHWEMVNNSTNINKNHISP